MPSLTESLDVIFSVGAWIGFLIFCVFGAFGIWMLAQILYITIRLAFARWRWRAYQKNIEDGNLMLAHELAQKFIREANKTEATEPRDNPYAPNNTTNNAQPDQQKKTSRSRTP